MSKGLARKWTAPIINTKDARNQTSMGCIPAINHLRARMVIQVAISKDEKVVIVAKPPIR